MTERRTVAEQVLDEMSQVFPPPTKGHPGGGLGAPPPPLDANGRPIPDQRIVERPDPRVDIDGRVVVVSDDEQRAAFERHQHDRLRSGWVETISSLRANLVRLRDLVLPATQAELDAAAAAVKALGRPALDDLTSYEAEAALDRRFLVRLQAARLARDVEAGEWYESSLRRQIADAQRQLRAVGG